MRKQVLIAGGGIGGLAAGIGAARADWDVRLFERAQQFTEVGAGVQLGPNAVRSLQAWGLQKELQSIAAFPEKLQVRSALSGQALARMILGRSAVERYGAAYATVHRADLHSLLRANLANYAQVHLNLAQSVEYCAQTQDAVTIRTNKLIEGDALVCADGVHSSLRQQILGDGPPQATGHLAYRAMVRQADLPERLRAVDVTAWLGPRLHAIQYPVRCGELQNLVVIVAGVVPQEIFSWDHAANEQGLEAALSGCCSALQDLVRSVQPAGGQWRLWPLFDRPPLRSSAEMAQGLVALLGDASHPMRPYLAQGAAMAIEDAAQLQRALSMHDLEVNLRLKRYALNRWQRNARVQARSVRNGQIFHATGLLRWGRDNALKLFGARLMDLPWLYRDDAAAL